MLLRIRNGFERNEEDSLRQLGRCLQCGIDVT